MFLRLNAEDSGDRSPWGSFWFSDVPYRGAPAQVNAETALRLTAVYRCVTLLSGTVSMLPFRLFRRRADGSKAYVVDHWLYRLWTRRPNPWQTPKEFRRMCQAHVELRGNAYAQIIGNAAGEVSDLVPIHPDRVTVEMLDDSNWRYAVKNRDGSTTFMPRSSVFHQRGMTVDGIMGLSPIAAARESIATGLAAQSYGMRFFQNDARPGGVIEMPGQFKTDDDKRKFREAWQAGQTGANKHKTAVLEHGMKYVAIDVSNADAQFIESRKYSVTDIARLFGVPPHKLADLDKATFSNIEQQTLEFVTDALLDRLTSVADSIRWYFIDDQDDLEVDFNLAMLLKGDSAALVRKLHGGITDGWLTRNEARIEDDREPLPGLDEPMRPLNMVEESQAEIADSGLGPGKEQQPAPADQNADRQLRLAALSGAAAERVARKERGMLETLRRPLDAARISEAYQKHATFVSRAMAVTIEAATDYCDARCSFILANPRMTFDDFEVLARNALEHLAAGL